MQKTDAAQEILAGEIRLRKLKPPPPAGQDDPQPAPRVSLDCVSEDDATEVVFDELVNQTENATRTSAPKYKWTCDSCGREWEGVQNEE
jgi:hypothetical protein